jgi:hypothetical protein
MNFDQVQKGVDQWCSGMRSLFPTDPITYTDRYTATDMSGQVVPMGKSLNSQVGGLILRSGGPGVLAGVYPRP